VAPRAGSGALLLALLHLLSPVQSCAQASARDTADVDAGYPAVQRRVASIVSPVWADESSRDRAGEADRVMDLLRIDTGMRVADIGAGTGYYAVRVARRLGPTGVVYAEDVDPAFLGRLDARLQREGLPMVHTQLGTPSDPQLPPSSVDVAILSHMYHEIESPYAFLARLAPAIAPGGRVGIVDLDRPTRSHGTPPALLRCELEAVGYKQTDFYMLTPAEGYLAVFAPPDRMPAPRAIHPCTMADR
jgi:SAM-dependent methyltransferase